MGAWAVAICYLLGCKLRMVNDDTDRKGVKKFRCIVGDYDVL